LNYWIKIFWNPTYLFFGFCFVYFQFSKGELDLSKLPRDSSSHGPLSCWIVPVEQYSSLSWVPLHWLISQTHLFWSRKSKSKNNISTIKIHNFTSGMKPLYAEQRTQQKKVNSMVFHYFFQTKLIKIFDSWFCFFWFIILQKLSSLKLFPSRFLFFLPLYLGNSSF